MSSRRRKASRPLLAPLPGPMASFKSLPPVPSQGPAENENRVPMPMRMVPRCFASMPPPPTQVPLKPPPARKDAPGPKPWSIEIPPEAPRYPEPPRKVDEGRHLDFGPWHGNHSEDHFSDHVIRQGFFDKAPIGQIETSSAKTAILPLIKQRTGPHMLSQIFTSVLGQRRHNGRVNKRIRFKLPPRVAVTDSKREAWLEDIAKPEIPLRKLSRTIPHGVRGKTLLEQCLKKRIPVDRAVWLSRTVGAQELRQFKRKSVNGTIVMGGEAKWIRDWTNSIEQFVESVMKTSGQMADWSAKMNYSIRLATSIFHEHLLDRDHYMDWLISNLESSSNDSLPFWLCLVQIYWRDILSMRRTGRRAVFTLLAHYHTFQNAADKAVITPLALRISQLLGTLLVRSAVNFVSPSLWFKHRDVLAALSQREDPGLRDAFEAADSRNERLAANSIPSVTNIVVKYLDSALQTPISNDFARESWNIITDKPALIRTLLEWATSLYRPGHVKVYVSSRLLSSWAGLFGVEVTEAILSFVDEDPLEEAERKSSFYHLVSELVRSGQFSITHYAQWLIARGGLGDYAMVAPGGKATTRLVAELPIHPLTESQTMLRAGLLRRARYDVASEEQDIKIGTCHLQHTLGLPSDDNAILVGSTMPLTKVSNRIRRSSRALKAHFGSWVRNYFVSSDLVSKDSKRVIDIRPSTFNAVRTILEAAEDYTMLSDVLRAMTATSNPEVLASCADTVNLHLSIFDAIGVTRELFELLLGRLRTVASEQGIGARPLLAALASLGRAIPGLEKLGSQLHNDLYRNDRSTAADAGSSPVSENTIPESILTNPQDVEELEKLLSTGTSLDGHAMERLFGTFAGRLQGCWEKADGELRAYSMLLTRLRLFDPPYFDLIMRKWLQHVRTVVSRPRLSQFFPLLISLECLSTSVVLGTTSDEPVGAEKSFNNTATSQSLVQRTWRSQYVQEVLQLMTAPMSNHPLLTHEECYRFSIKQSQARKKYSKELLVLLRNALAEYSICVQQGAGDPLLDNRKTLGHVLELLRSLVPVDPAPVARALAVENADPAVARIVEWITARLLAPNLAEGATVSFDQLLERTDELTLPFSQLRLSSSLTMGDPSGQDAGERMQSHLEMFARAVDRAIYAKNIAWTGLLSCLPPEMSQQVKNRTQMRFFQVLPSAKTPLAQDGTLEQNVRMARNLLDVLKAIVRGGSLGRPAQLLPFVIDKLADVWEVLSTGDNSARQAVLSYWLPDMLTFLTLHTGTFDPSKASNEVRGKALLVLSGILAEFGHLPPDVEVDSSLKERVFDIALLLVDNLADDVRLKCIRVLHDAMDSRLRYIFSYAPTPTDNLKLSHFEGSDRDKSALGATWSKPGLAGAGGSGPFSPLPTERLSRFVLKRWETISDPSPSVQENDSSLNLSLFEAIKLLK